jgi:hypothetical protein
MDSVRMIIGDVILEETTQVNLVACNYVIQEISAAASDPTFCNSILPKTCGAYAFRLHCAGSQEIGYFLTKLAITIENRVAVKTRFPEGLPQLLHNPRAGRMFRDIEVEDPPPAVFDDKETIQDPEGESGYSEKVHGRDDLAVIAQKSSPEFPCLIAGR